MRNRIGMYLYYHGALMWLRQADAYHNEVRRYTPYLNTRQRNDVYFE